jgi:transcriptional regulator with XRE-family HTH domain
MYGTPHMVSSTSQRSITEPTSREPYTVGLSAVEARRRGLRLSVVLDDPTRKARLAYAIRSARDRRGLTPPQLADRLHVGRGTVNKWESGEQVPNLLMLGPLCEALGVDANLFAVLPPYIWSYYLFWLLPDVNRGLRANLLHDAGPTPNPVNRIVRGAVDTDANGTNRQRLVRRGADN